MRQRCFEPRILVNLVIVMFSDIGERFGEYVGCEDSLYICWLNRWSRLMFNDDTTTGIVVTKPTRSTSE